MSGPRDGLKTIKANGITLCYEDRGPVDGRPLLLVNGYTSTLKAWSQELLDALKARGFRVIRYDNRDAGKSEKLQGIPDPLEVMQAMQAGKPAHVPYTLSDMAADGMGLLDALGIERAHIMGVSMGGMIVQSMAINHPEKLISVTSIMSTTGNPAVPQGTDEAIAALMGKPASDERGEVLRHSMACSRALQSPAYPASDETLLASCSIEYDYMYYPEGASRQYAAIVTDGNRVDRLKTVRLPFLVIHGKADPILVAEGGVDTANSVPGARLELIDGMGHDLPVELIPRIVDLMSDLADSAASASRAHDATAAE
ncbi:MAG TPA: alpha/beta hydrolase [Parvibaculum sp.]|jgi:pimeloyl-ACP methyl ester carboxylesterase